MISTEQCQHIWMNWKLIPPSQNILGGQCWSPFGHLALVLGLTWMNLGRHQEGLH